MFLTTLSQHTDLFVKGGHRQMLQCNTASKNLFYKISLNNISSKMPAV